MNSACIRNVSGLYFHVFGLNTEICGDLQSKFCIQFECGEIRAKKYPNTDTFYSVVAL